MLRDIKDALQRNQNTIAQDMLGAAALVVVLMVGLSVPGMV